MYVICAGMYRSCSTWQYQIASHLIEQYLGGQRLGFVKGTEFAERCPRPSEPAVWHTLKSHDNHPDFVPALTGGLFLPKPYSAGALLRTIATCLNIEEESTNELN